MTSSPSVILGKGRIPSTSGTHLFLEAEDTRCQLRCLHEGQIVSEEDCPWDAGTWLKVEVPGQGVVDVYIDPAPWRPAHDIAMPVPGNDFWYWLSYCGWRNDVWYDGPLGWFVGDRVASYLPPLGTSSLSCGRAAESTSSWADVKTTTLPSSHHLHSAALALAARWQEAPIVQATTLQRADALHLLCLARAFPDDRLDVELTTSSPEARKFLAHIGARLRTPSLQQVRELKIEVAELAPLLAPFASGLPEDAARLSDVIPSARRVGDPQRSQARWG